MKNLAAISLAAYASMMSPTLSKSLNDLLLANPDCRQFNDGCSICRIEDGKPMCSTPGIACIQKQWICVISSEATNQTRSPTTTTSKHGDHEDE